MDEEGRFHYLHHVPLNLTQISIFNSWSSIFFHPSDSINGFCTAEAQASSSLLSVQDLNSAARLGVADVSPADAGGLAAANVAAALPGECLEAPTDSVPVDRSAAASGC